MHHIEVRANNIYHTKYIYLVLIYFELHVQQSGGVVIQASKNESKEEYHKRPRRRRCAGGRRLEEQATIYPTVRQLAIQIPAVGSSTMSFVEPPPCLFWKLPPRSSCSETFATYTSRRVHT